MALLCPSCGAENRDKARFCRGCARPLDRTGDEHEAVDPAAADAARARRLARRHRHARAHRPAWSRWAGVITAAVIALAAGWWLGARQTTPAPAQAAPLPAMTLPASATSAVPLPAAAPPAVTSTATPGEAVVPSAAAAVDRLRHSVEELEQQDRARAARAQQQARLAQERLRAEEARRKTDALAASAAAGAATAPAPAAPATVATGPVATPVQAAAVPSVDQLCAGSGNVLARDFCRMRECGQAAHASDPVCVRFRQMDEARRRDN